MKHLILLSLFALAACGGGGGGTSSSIPSTPVMQQHAPLKSGFTSTSSTSSFGRTTLALSSQIAPVTEFVIPSGSTAPFEVVSSTAVAYYDTSQGSAPNPLPSGTWTTSAPVSLKPATPPGLGQPLVAIGASLVTMPTTAGKSGLTFHASNGDATSINVYAYNGYGVSTIPLSDTAHSPGFDLCLTFSGSGITQSPTGDFCLHNDANNATSVVLAHGGVLLNKTISQVGTSDIANLPAGPTTFSAASVVALGSYSTTYVFKDAANGVDKCMMVYEGFTPATGNLQIAYGACRRGTQSGWDF